MGLPTSLLRLGIVVSLSLLTTTCATPPRQPPGGARISLPASSTHAQGPARAAAPHQPPHESLSAVRARSAPAAHASALPVGIDVRHNTNYVSNAKDLQRELNAFEAMRRADPDAIHELYMLNGTLVRRYVPPGVQYP